MTWAAILAVINNISCEVLTDEDALIAQITPASTGLPLPAVDLDPHFRYLDELEELSGLVAGRLTRQEAVQKDIAAQNAALYAGFSIQNKPGNNMASGSSSAFDTPMAQKIAAYNLLKNSEKKQRQ